MEGEAVLVSREGRKAYLVKAQYVSGEGWSLLLADCETGELIVPSQRNGNWRLSLEDEEALLDRPDYDAGREGREVSQESRRSLRGFLCGERS